MSDVEKSPDERQMVAVMTEACRRIVRSKRTGFVRDFVEDIAGEAAGELLDAMVEDESFAKSAYGGDAYILWAEIGDLVGFVGSPGSVVICNQIGYAMATDWLSIDADSDEAIQGFFCPMGLPRRRSLQRSMAPVGADRGELSETGHGCRSPLAGVDEPDRSEGARLRSERLHPGSRLRDRFGRCR